MAKLKALEELRMPNVYFLVELAQWRESWRLVCVIPFKNGRPVPSDCPAIQWRQRADKNKDPRLLRNKIFNTAFVVKTNRGQMSSSAS